MKTLERFYPVGSLVLCQPDDFKFKGILLPDTMKGKAMEPYGTVLRVGEGLPDGHGGLTPMPVKPGDRIRVSSWNGFAVEEDGKGYMCIQVGQIIGRIETCQA